MGNTPFEEVTILDGGLGSELAKVAPEVNQNPLWSAAILHSQPDTIVEVHKAYYQAGADVVTGASYQASVQGFCKHLDVNREEALELIKLSVKLAQRACKDVAEQKKLEDPSKLKVAGSIGPYGAALCDGSEYTGSYVESVTEEQLADWHRPRMEALVESGVDFLAIETIPALKEAEVLAKLLKEFPEQKAWISFSCKDSEHISNGDSFAKAAQTLWQLNPQQLVAIGINCTSPQFIAPLLKSAVEFNSGKLPGPFVVYPNRGEEWVAGQGWTNRGDLRPLESYVKQWLDLGVRYLGGCCRTTPDDITNMKSEVGNWLKDYNK